MADRSGNRHGNEHQRNRNDFGQVVEMNIFQSAEHQNTDIDQRCGSSGSGNDRGNGSDEDAGQEEDTGGQRGQTGRCV